MLARSYRGFSIRVDVNWTEDAAGTGWKPVIRVCRPSLTQRIHHPQTRDLCDLVQRRLDLLLARILQALGERGQDRLLAVLAGADHEREAELFPVRGIVMIERRDLAFTEL